MASQGSKAEMDLLCPICHCIFDNPVFLTCGHNSCKTCLQRWWAVKPNHECPICKRRSSKDDPPINFALKNLCESFSQGLSLEEKASLRSEAVCSLHSEKLRLFCLDCQNLVCLICRDSKKHTNHMFRPIDEAAEDYKEELRKFLKPVEEKLEYFYQVKVQWNQTATHISEQAVHTEMQIKEQFKKLHQFLEKEEEARITALNREKVQKSTKMVQRIETLDREIAALSDTVRAAEEELKTGSLSFLQNYKPAVERTQQRPLLTNTELTAGALIDTAKHLGNLTFNIWSKMKELVSYTPVILDPNSASPYLIVSENLRSVRYTANKRELPRNPDRFEDYATVVGSEGFNSGTHSWDVEVQNDSNWAVGLIAESVQRRGDIPTGYWEIWYCDGNYKAFSPPHIDKALYVRTPIRKIRVHLDWNKGQVSFSDAETNTKLHTFSHTFTGRLFPFINTLNEFPLRISPVKVTAQSEM